MWALRMLTVVTFCFVYGGLTVQPKSAATHLSVLMEYFARQSLDWQEPRRVSGKHTALPISSTVWRFLPVRGGNEFGNVRV